MQVAAAGSPAAFINLRILGGRVSEYLVSVLGPVLVFPPGYDEPIALQPAENWFLAMLVAGGRHGVPVGTLKAERSNVVDSTSTPLTDPGASIRKLRSNVKKKLPAGWIGGGPDRVFLRLERDQVDAWRLLDTATDEMTGHLLGLLDGYPFDGVSPTKAIDDAVQDLTRRRRLVVERLVADGDRNLIDVHLPAIHRLLGHWNHIDLRLPLAVAEAHELANEIPTATRILDQVDEVIGESGTETRESADRRRAVRARMAERTRPDEGPTAYRSPALARLPGHPIVGRDELIKEVVAEILRGDHGAAGLVLHGPSGAGTTVVAIEIGARLNGEGLHVLFVDGREDAPTSYRPFLYDPILRAVVEPLLAEPRLDRVHRQQLHLGVAGELGRWSGNAPICLIVDHADLLDSHSRHLVDFLAGTRTDAGLTVVVVGRDEDHHPRWARERARLEHGGAASRTVGPFDNQAMAELAEALTDRPRTWCHAEAPRLVRESGGLPAVAAILIAGDDPSWSSRFSFRTYGVDLSTPLSGEAQLIGAVAAVLPDPFTLGEVRELMNASSALPSPREDGIQMALGELQRRGYLVIAENDIAYRFRHSPLREELQRASAGHQPEILHARAAPLTSDVHRRAWHANRAGPLLDVSERANLLLDSARAHTEAGSLAEAHRAYAAADRLDRLALGITDLAAFAGAAERTGNDADDQRRRAVELALATGRPDVALRACTVDLEETEAVAGDRTRLELLDLIRKESLSPAEEHELAVASARLKAGLGDSRGAGRDFTRALRLAEHPELAADRPAPAWDAWISIWPLLLRSPPSAWPPMPEDVSKLKDPARRARFFQVRAVRALIEAPRHEQRAAVDEFQAEAEESGDPLRVWHSLLLQALGDLVDGQLAKFDARSKAALDHATRTGLTNGHAARLAQVFLRSWLGNDFVELADRLQSSPTDLKVTDLAEAAMIVAVASSDSAAAGSQAIELMMRSWRTGSPFVTPVAALLAPLIGLTGDFRAIEVARSVLEPLSGAVVVAGTGLADLGPADRYLAFLEQDTLDREQQLRRAGRLAHRAGLRLWQVKINLDLFAETNDGSHWSRARNLADGTDLDTLFRRA